MYCSYLDVLRIFQLLRTCELLNKSTRRYPIEVVSWLKSQVEGRSYGSRVCQLHFQGTAISGREMNRNETRETDRITSWVCLYSYVEYFYVSHIPFSLRTYLYERIGVPTCSSPSISSQTFVCRGRETKLDKGSHINPLFNFTHTYQPFTDRPLRLS